MKSRGVNLCIYAGLLLLTAAAYAPALTCDFVNFDDQLYVTENDTVQAGLCPSGIYYAVTTIDDGNWIPLTWLSYELDSSLFGLNPAGFHATNVLWHMANVCLLFLALKRMTGATGRSAVAAALFAVHPLHVESVAWVAERKDVLSTFWLLTAVLAYEHYARQPSFLRYAGIAAAMALGLMSKSMLVTLPLLLCLLDFWPLQRWRLLGESETPYPQRTSWQLCAEKLPLVLLSFTSGLFTVIAQSYVGAVAKLPLPLRLGNAIRACGWYLWKTCSPVGLCVYYVHPLESLSWGDVAVSAILLLSITLGTLIAYFRSGCRFPLVGWLWFVISLLPVIGILQVGQQAQADRYAYVPHIGLFVLIVWAGAALANRVPGARRTGLTGAAILIAACLGLTFRQVETWRNSATIWEQALAVDPDNSMAHLNLGKYLAEHHRHPEAEFHFQRTLERANSTQKIKALTNLGRLNHETGRLDQAQEYYLKALQLEPNNILAINGLKEIAQQQPAVPVAEPSETAKAENRAGLSLARQGRLEEALYHFRAALSLEPGFAAAQSNAGLALINLRRMAEAESYFRRAVELDPSRADYFVNLAGLLETQGRRTEARELYQSAVALNPDDKDVKARWRKLVQSKE